MKLSPIVALSVPLLASGPALAQGMAAGGWLCGPDAPWSCASSNPAAARAHRAGVAASGTRILPPARFASLKQRGLRAGPRVIIRYVYVRTPPARAAGLRSSPRRTFAGRRGHDARMAQAMYYLQHINAMTGGMGGVSGLGGMGGLSNLGGMAGLSQMSMNGMSLSSVMRMLPY